MTFCEVQMQQEINNSTIFVFFESSSKNDESSRENEFVDPVIDDH